jgi:hypothetical protein
LFTGLLQAAVLEFLKGLSVYYTALTISRKLLFLGDNFIFFLPSIFLCSTLEKTEGSNETFHPHVFFHFIQFFNPLQVRKKHAGKKKKK